MSGGGCPACDGSWPAPTHRIVELAATVAYLNEDPFFPGWTFLGLRRHATELWQLLAGERATMIEEVARVARALGAVCQAAWTLPHDPPRLPAGEVTERIAAIRRQLEA